MAFVFIDDCSEDDGCSICLEPFSSHDPSTVTNCKHEYHLHCILEWSQRSSECPICCQLLALKDPTGQELLRAAQSERSLRSKNTIRVVPEAREVNHVPPYVNDSDLEERILQHFAAQRRRHISSEMNYSRTEMDDGNYLTDSRLTATVENGDGSANHRNYVGESSPDGSSSSSEFVAFSESVKAKLSAASAKYKESITKSTLGFKEKLLARNSTVKELGRGVQREMSAGISGIARMMERFDLSAKRAGDRAASESPRAHRGQVEVTLS